MLDIKLIREQTSVVKTGLSKKNVDSSTLDQLLTFDTCRRSLLAQVETLKADRNQTNQEISKAKREGKPVDAVIDDIKTLSQKISKIDAEVGQLDENIAKLIYSIPNIPHSSTPDGASSKQNKIVRTVGEIKKFSFKPKDHIEIAKHSEWIRFDRAAKVTGSGFALFQSGGARLVRALINFMVDLHVKRRGYQEIWPPALVNRASMTGTGQLPKMEEDMYRLADDDLFLIPTAEVPVSNMHRDEILSEEELPLKYVAYTPCFRREAGSYGKDTRGLSRVHQFDKVELVKFVKPEHSLDELEGLVGDAEEVLKILEIPYRVALLCAGDLSFAAAKCYDIEAYAPGMDRWLEVSSCSAFFDFQARRMNAKFRPAGGGKAQFVHTLNGSGVALARTIICLLENHQQKDGTIRFPEALRKYME